MTRGRAPVLIAAGLALSVLVGLGWLAIPLLGDVLAGMLRTPATRKLAVETLKLAALCTLTCLVLGAPIAWSLRLGSARLRRDGRAAGTLTPGAMGLIARTAGLVVVVGEFGLLNLVLRVMRIEAELPRASLSELAVLGGMTQVFAPFMVLALLRAMGQVPIGTVRALRSLGVSHARIFWHVALPRARAGMAIGVTTVFALATGAVATVASFGSRRVRALAGLAFEQSESLLAWQVAAVALVLGGLLLMLLGRWILATGAQRPPNSREAAPVTSSW